MKVKRFLPIVLSLFLIGGAFAGCTTTPEGSNPEDDNHTEHTWSTGYTPDGEKGHHKVSTCEGHSPVDGENETHQYNEDYKCTVCNYQHQHAWSTTYTPDRKGAGHYYVTTCTIHSEIKGDMEDHTYDDDSDATCNDCVYTRVPPHKHTWSAAYTSAEEKGHYKTATCAGHTDQKSDMEDHVYDNASDLTCNSEGCGYTREADTSTALASDKKIYVVGDSTVCSFNDGYYLPRYGYGTQLAQYLNVQESQVVNLALSGRSSKSFLTEDNYTTLTDNIGDGDYLIIGFGHNDEKSDDVDRYTSPVGDHTKEGSFQKSLYDNYIKKAKDAGATPILCTPITRYDSSGKYTGSKVHVTSDGDYAAAIKALGEATDTTVIDLTKLTSDMYKADNVSAQYFHAHTTYAGTEDAKVPSGRDDTHINKYGAEMIAYLFANALKATDCSLSAQVITNATAPTKGTHFTAAINNSYVKPEYKPFEPASNSGRLLTSGWYKTTMGDLGGASKMETIEVSYKNEVFTVSNTNNNGKITETIDGFGAAFRRVAEDKNFKISVTAKVTAMSSSVKSQSAFGIMLRDDIYLGTYSQALSTNYVAAGAFAKDKGAIFARENAALACEGNSFTAELNKEYTMSIERVGQAVTVKFGNNTKVYTDFDFVAVDNDYMYICLFANRGLTVEFSNVQFEITGTSQGA
ncbi:MAG: hypothetical protein K2O67_01120 [Clostridia bacterium]|nr:hypothetical protein [Clostridia bacterium]